MSNYYKPVNYMYHCIWLMKMNARDFIAVKMMAVSIAEVGMIYLTFVVLKLS